MELKRRKRKARETKEKKKPLEAKQHWSPSERKDSWSQKKQTRRSLDPQLRLSEHKCCKTECGDRGWFLAEIGSRLFDRVTFLWNIICSTGHAIFMDPRLDLFRSISLRTREEKKERGSSPCYLRESVAGKQGLWKDLGRLWRIVAFSGSVTTLCTLLPSFSLLLPPVSSRLPPRSPVYPLYPQKGLHKSWKHPQIIQDQTFPSSLPLSPSRLSQKSSHTG